MRVIAEEVLRGERERVALEEYSMECVNEGLRKVMYKVVYRVSKV
jgi:hypothetical protein